MNFATPETGLVGILVLVVLLLSGMPIGVALGLVGFGGLTIVLGLEPALIKSGVVFFETITKYELGTLPLFLLMAQFCFQANASRDFFDAASRFLGHRRGGLAYASVSGCAAFGAINGSSLATAATIGMVAVPEMRQRGYSDGIATGSVVAGGTLGQMIPPSGALIVFGIVAEQSIGTLFQAAILPGLTQMLFYFAAIFLLMRWRPGIAPATERAPWSERWRALGKVADFLGLIAIVIGGITLGWFTPTEAASVGALGALLMTVLRKQLSINGLLKAIEETLATSGMIYVVIVGALVFSVFVSVTGLTDAATDMITSMDAGVIVTVLLMALLLLVLGSVLDGLALMLLTTPILLPIVQELGLSPIWFGIFIVRAMEIGFVHPPLGLNLYVVKGIAPDIPLGRVFSGVMPFLAADFVHLLLIILFPAIALYLPEVLSK